MKDKKLAVRRALRYTIGEQMKYAIEEKGGETKIQFADGIVIVS